MPTPEAAASHGCEPAAAQSADTDVGTHSRRLVACFFVSCNYSLKVASPPRGAEAPLHPHFLFAVQKGSEKNICGFAAFKFSFLVFKNSIKICIPFQPCPATLRTYPVQYVPLRPPYESRIFHAALCCPYFAGIFGIPASIFR